MSRRMETSFGKCEFVDALSWHYVLVRRMAIFLRVSIYTVVGASQKDQGMTAGCIILGTAWTHAGMPI